MSQLVVSARSVRRLMLILKWFYVKAGICRWWLIIMIMIGMTTCFVMWLIGQIALVSLLVIVWNHGIRQDSNRSIQRIRIEIKSASRIFRVVTSVTLDCWWFEKKPLAFMKVLESVILKHYMASVLAIYHYKERW